MSQHMGCDASASQRWGRACRQGRVLLQDIGGAIAREACATSAAKHPILWLDTADDLQSLQSCGGVTPERTYPLLVALTEKTHMSGITE